VAKVPESALDRLRSQQLFGFPPFGPNHGWPDGVRIARDSAVENLNAGNESDNYEDAIIVVHEPGPVLYSRDGELWCIHGVDGCGGYIPGDFVHCWPSLDEAVDDVIDFFSDSSIRCKAKERRQEYRELPVCDAEVTDEALKRLRQNGIIEVGNETVENGERAVTFASEQHNADGEPVLYLYRWQRKGWCVDGRIPPNKSQRELLFGEFFHVWAAIDDAVDDMIDFWNGNQIRRRAWIEGWNKSD